MRRLARIPFWWAAAALLCASPGLAQVQSGESAPPLRLRALIVWIVNPQNDPNPLALRKKVAQVVQPIQYQESTAADFGHTAMGTGQTAGSVGKTMGESSQTAGSAGQTSSSTGQTAGSFGTTAGSVGKNAGDAGSTMGNFGTSTTDLPRVAAAKNSIIPAANQPPRRSSDWNTFVDHLPKELFRSFSPISYVDVYANDLPALLDATAGSADAPDVLMGSPLPWSWAEPDSPLAAHYGVAALWHAPRFIQAENSAATRRFDPEAVVTSVAFNPKGAREFCHWLADRDAVQGGFENTPQNNSIAQLGVRAMLTLLAGGSIGEDADPEMAHVSGSLAAAMFAGPRPIALDQIHVEAEATHLSIFGKLAFVTVAATGNSQEAFGVAHALLILRRDEHNRWKVLQVSPDLEGAAQSRGWNTLMSYSRGSKLITDEGSDVMRNEGTKVLGISQAIPKDGDSLSPQPELWWDNLGGATLQAVEWQQGTGEAWGASNLYFIPDNTRRLRTRATARFAATPGQYRWRVWSVGTGGDVVLSPWRTMKIIGG